MSGRYVAVGLRSPEDTALVVQQWRVPDEFARQLIAFLRSTFGEPLAEAVLEDAEAMSLMSDIEAKVATPFVWRDGAA